MSVKEHVKLLEKRFHELKVKLEILDKDVVREKKFDFGVMDDAQLEQYLESNSRPREKIRLLLSQIGYLRINIFYECYARLQAAEKNSDFDKALPLMNEYIEEIALPFLLPRMKQSWLSRLSGKLSETTVFLQKWRLGYKSWSEKEPTLNEMAEKERVNEFNDLKQTFITLFSLSFTYENFPPVLGAEEREYL